MFIQNILVRCTLEQP